MREKIRKFLGENPRLRRAIGVLLVIIGLISVITPFTPVGFLLVVGLEILGIRYLVWNKLKNWLKRLFF
ncbi:MAG: hypothetical protein HYT69_00435 [Candidatus Zambryskibacteria bacterium]|nr:hypothetical protein [Candidatus Zambryskibacteria bacterium]